MQPGYTLTGVASAVQSVGGSILVTIGGNRVPVSAITGVRNTL